MAGEGVEQGHVQVVPDLDRLIPRGSNAKCGLSGVIEADHGDSVLMIVFVDGELAFRARVPDLDVSVEGSSDDLSVISGKSDREDVLLVADKLGDGSASSDIPKTNSAIP